ncbi:MAG: hypothetical protein Q8O55_10105 [Dehalococcoidales bacterium]|nr:hypothetical protein [Dehalococcoidales bacterium]
MTRIWKYLLPLSLAMLLAAAACQAPATTVPSGELTITEKEFEFIPNKIMLKVGQEVRITLSNMGEKDHEFMVGRDVRMEDGIPDGFMTDFFEGVEVTAERDSQSVPVMMLMEPGMTEEEMAEHSFMVWLEAGSSPATIIFTVPANKVGEWTFGCFEDDGDHWEEGMRGTLTVER